MTAIPDRVDKGKQRRGGEHVVVLPYPTYEQLHPLLHLLANLILASPELNITILLPPFAAQHTDVVLHLPAMAHINGRSASVDGVFLRRAPINRIQLLPLVVDADQTSLPFPPSIPGSVRAEMEQSLPALPQILTSLFELDSDGEGFRRRPTSFLLNLGLPEILERITSLVDNDVIPRIPINGYYTASATELVSVLGQQSDAFTEDDHLAVAYGTAHDSAITAVVLPTYTELEADALVRLEEELDKPVIPAGFQHPDIMWESGSIPLSGYLPEEEDVRVAQFLDRSAARYGVGSVVYVDLDRFPSSASALLPALLDLGAPLVLGYSQPLSAVIADLVRRIGDSPRVCVIPFRPGRGGKAAMLKQEAIGLWVSECGLTAVGNTILCEKPLLAIPTRWSDALNTHVKSSFGIILDLPLPSPHKPEPVFRAQLTNLWSYIQARGGELRQRLVRLRTELEAAYRDDMGMRNVVARL